MFSVVNLLSLLVVSNIVDLWVYARLQALMIMNLKLMIVS
jgi:hypothetical protein